MSILFYYYFSFRNVLKMYRLNLLIEINNDPALTCYVFNFFAISLLHYFIISLFLYFISLYKCLPYVYLVNLIVSKSCTTIKLNHPCLECILSPTWKTMIHYLWNIKTNLDTQLLCLSGTML